MENKYMPQSVTSIRDSVNTLPPLFKSITPPYVTHCQRGAETIIDIFLHESNRDETSLPLVLDLLWVVIINSPKAHDDHSSTFPAWIQSTQPATDIYPSRIFVRPPSRDLEIVFKRNPSEATYWHRLLFNDSLTRMRTSNVENWSKWGWG